MVVKVITIKANTNLPPLLWDSIINFKRQTAQESHDGNIAKQIANVIYNGQTNPKNDPDIKKKTSYIMTMSNAHKQGYNIILLIELIQKHGSCSAIF